jgi:hypothetical protein
MSFDFHPGVESLETVDLLSRGISAPVVYDDARKT